MTLPFDVDRSDRRCPRCHKALAVQRGPDTDGVVTDQHYCLHCDYLEASRPAKANRITRGEVRTLARMSRRLLLGPSCRGRRHRNCNAPTCECPCHTNQENPS